MSIACQTIAFQNAFKIEDGNGADPTIVATYALRLTGELFQNPIIRFTVALTKMNFLAHAYLSYGHAGLLTGNLISDFVKGAAQYRYPLPIQQGIRLHRAIDAFTDAHPATRAATHFFKTPYRLYSGPIVDILYDHFLATDKSIFPNDTLLSFSHNVYNMLESDAVNLPANFARMFGYMKVDNWLWNYRKPEGIKHSLQSLRRRATYLTESETAFSIFQTQYSELKQCYQSFIPDVKTFAKQQIGLP